MDRRTWLITTALLGCSRTATVANPQLLSYDALLAAVDAERRALRDPRAARRSLRSAVEEIGSRWIGTRWSFQGTAQRPHEPRGIACGYFVATILEAAGLRLESRVRFGQATARAIQLALVPSPAAHHRFFSIPGLELERRIRALGDGLYVIGLDVHVGFVVVRDGAVRLLHASYTGARVVVDEPLGTAVAIENSRKAGYFVTALTADDALAQVWMQGTVVPAPA